MNIRELYNLVEMLPEAALGYIVNRMTGDSSLTKDEVQMLSTWITKNQTVDRTSIIRQILLAIDYANIKYIDNPTEEEQYKAVCSEATLIQYIKNPSENIQMAALQGGTPASRIFNMIEQPSESLFIAVIKESPAKIIGMTEPTEAQQMAAISKQPSLITNTTVKWCFKAQRKAFEIEKDYFQYLSDPTEDECWIALQHNPSFLKHITEPSDDMKSFAIIVS